MQGFAQESKNPAVTRKGDSRSKGILTQNLSPVYIRVSWMCAFEFYNVILLSLLLKPLF